MKTLIATLLLAILPLTADARALMVATAGTGETMTLTDERWECPTGERQDGERWTAFRVEYHDPRDNERVSGCYVIDTEGNEKVVIIIFKSGSYAGQPLFIPTRAFRPEV